jgi:hypothetical protein
MLRGKEVIVESQSGSRDREEALPKAAVPGTEHHGAEKQRREGLGMPEVPHHPRENNRQGNRNERDRTPQNSLRCGPPFLGFRSRRHPWIFTLPTHSSSASSHRLSYAICTGQERARRNARWSFDPNLIVKRSNGSRQAVEFSAQWQRAFT